MLRVATAPGTPATTRQGRTIYLSDLLGRPITDSRGESLGRVDDVVVSLPGSPLPVVKGLVVKVGGREVFVPTEQTGVFDGKELKPTAPNSTCAASSAGTARTCCAGTYWATGSSTCRAPT